MSKPGLVHEADVNDGDPLIVGRTVRVLFSDSKYNYQTTINGTRDEIANYFCGAKLNVSNSEEVIRTPNRLEFISESEDGQTIAYSLPSQKVLLYRGYEIEYVAPPIGTRAFDWQFTAVSYDGPEDDRCGSAASLEEVKTRIDEWIEDALFEEEKLQRIGSDL